MLEIREVQPQDFFSIIKLAYESLTEVYSPMVFNTFYESYPKGFLVAEKNKKIVGFIIGIKMSDVGAKISMMAVNKNYRRNKIGSLLINNLIQRLKQDNVLILDLEVRTNNTSAIQFYKKHGFIISEKILKFYQTGEDAYIMERKLHAN